MFIHLFVLFFCVSSCMASDQKPEKGYVYVPIGTCSKGKFVQQSTSKIKLDLTCTLEELQTWLNNKYGTGTLHFCDMRILLSPHINAGMQNGTPIGTDFIMSNFRIPLPTDEELEKSYVSVIPTYAYKTIDDLKTIVEGDLGKDLKFRFIQ